MKKAIFLLASLVLCLGMNAAEVNELQAQQKAQTFLEGKQLKLQNLKLKRAPSVNGSKGYYVFNVEDNGGFVIIAGDDRMPEILGYAEHGNFDLSKAPDNVKWLFSYYADVAKALKNTPEDAATAQRVAARRRTSATRTELIALLKTKWNQSGIYQEYCPEINDTKTLTGCVATAMAQVVNFFQWPLNSVRESVGYTTNKNDDTKPHIEMETLPAKKFNWFDMSENDIAWLMKRNMTDGRNSISTWMAL